jgi:predicted nucleotidyltransferase component of viral defense system
LLTRQQLKRTAQGKRIGLQALERNYLQNLFLALVDARTQSLIFKGGTALRIVHRSGRYSEDLDFNAAIGLAEVRQLWTDVVKDLERYGIAAEELEAWQSEVSYSFDVSCGGPLYDGRDRTQGKVRMVLSLRQETVDTERELVRPEYDNLRRFVVNLLTPAHLLAEKVRTLVNFSAARYVNIIMEAKPVGAGVLSLIYQPAREE